MRQSEPQTGPAQRAWCRRYYEKILAIAQEIKRSHDAVEEDRYAMPQAYDKNAKGISEPAKLLKTRYKCAPPPPAPETPRSRGLVQNSRLLFHGAACMLRLLYRDSE